MQDLVGQRRTPWRERGGMGVTVVVCCVCVCVRDGESFGSGGGFNIGIGIEHWEKGLGVLLPCSRPHGSGGTAGGRRRWKGGEESRCGRSQLLLGLVRLFSCCYGCGCAGSPVSGRFVHSGLFPSGQMVGGRTSRCCVEVVAVGSRLWVELFYSGIGSFSLGLARPFGEEGTMGSGCKRGQVRPEPEAVCSFCFYGSNSSSLTHPLSPQRRSILFQFSIVESSLLSDLDSPSPSVFFWSKSKHLVGPRNTTSKIPTDPSLPHHRLSFLSLSPGVQDILSLIAETDHECDLRPAVSVGQVGRVLSGNSGDAT